MNLKTLVQILIITLVVSIFLLVYYIYFYKVDTTTTKLKDKEQFELVVENEYDDDKSIKNSSSLEDVEYKSTDKKGNKYLVNAKFGKISAEFNNKKVGSFGEISVFSFYPTKSLGAYGDAGIICTNNKKIKDKIKKLRFYGVDKNYVADIDGYNSRMDEIQAGILKMKLKRLDQNITYRDKIRNLYKENINNKKLKLIEKPKTSLISNYLIPFLCITLNYLFY